MTFFSDKRKSPSRVGISRILIAEEDRRGKQIFSFAMKQEKTKIFLRRAVK